MVFYWCCMTETRTPAGLNRPSPLPYQKELVRYLQTEEAGLWKWYSSMRQREEHAAAVRLDLLKSSYRLERTSQPKLYGMADEILGAFGLGAPVTIYQAQTGAGLNAALAYLPGEAHVVLTGSLWTVLADAEVCAVLAHELAHFLLYEEWEGDFFVAQELLHGLSHEQGVAPSHLESARLYRLYGEVFADRGSYLVTGDAAVAMAALIKLQTGLSEVSVESYLRQAEEIFAKSKVQARHGTHPELYIRVRALQLYADQREDALPEIEPMIEGPLALDRLDLLGQKKVANYTRCLLDCLLAPAWMRSETVMAHARLFFANYAPPTTAVNDKELLDKIGSAEQSLRDYFCYVLLDFVTVDREQEDAALAAAIVLSRRLGLGPRFLEIAAKELGLNKKQLAKVEREAEQVLAATREATIPA